jgi:hypothetical protein
VNGVLLSGIKLRYSTASVEQGVSSTCEAFNIEGNNADTAELCTSELVTNAFRHAAGIGSLLMLGVKAASIRVSVYDSSPSMPAIRQADADACGGRGLHLIDQLADAGGVTPGSPIGFAEGGKGVWFELCARR